MIQSDRLSVFFFCVYVSLLRLFINDPMIQLTLWTYQFMHGTYSDDDAMSTQNPIN